MSIPTESLTAEEFTRLANNFYIANNIAVDYIRIGTDSHLTNYVATHRDDVKKKYKVAFVWICLNPLYWQFAKDMILGAKQFFLPGHEVEYFVWSDIPELDSPELKTLLESLPTEADIAAMTAQGQDTKMLQSQESVLKIVQDTRKEFGNHIFFTEGAEWPIPTLMRYHLFLQQEEKLKEFDYIFYCDVDMKFVNVVGDEILGSGLTAALHPMYAFDKTMWPPYEPNKESKAYIPRPGQVIDDGGRPRFMPMYFAGGLQGGKSDEYIKAMKIMKKNIDADFNKNYIPIWNDESIWNRYLFDNPPSVVLTPSYIYPDSLIKEFYEPRWGCVYQPKLITLTKKFSIKQLTPEEQRQITAMQGVQK